VLDGLIETLFSVYAGKQGSAKSIPIIRKPFLEADLLRIMSLI
jgi:hypothetical protein